MKRIVRAAIAWLAIGDDRTASCWQKSHLTITMRYGARVTSRDYKEQDTMPAIDGNTTVSDLLTEHPNAFDVLLSHGMCQDCKDNPPPVPLEHFAQKHCDGDLKNLIEQLEAAIHYEDSEHS